MNGNWNRGNRREWGHWGGNRELGGGWNWERNLGGGYAFDLPASKGPELPPTDAAPPPRPAGVRGVGGGHRESRRVSPPCPRTRPGAGGCGAAPLLSCEAALAPGRTRGRRRGGETWRRPKDRLCHRGRAGGVSPHPQRLPPAMGELHTEDCPPLFPLARPLRRARPAGDSGGVGECGASGREPGRGGICPHPCETPSRPMWEPSGRGGGGFGGSPAQPPHPPPGTL